MKVALFCHLQNPKKNAIVKERENFKFQFLISTFIPFYIKKGVKMENTISALIKGYLDTGNEECFEELLKRFSPLIKAYARKLYYLEYEDSLQELSLALYEAVRKIPSADDEYGCISYINRSVVNRFTKLYHNSVEIQNIQAHSVSLDASDNRDCQHDYETDNCISLVDLESALKSKLPIERKILYLLMLGYSDKEIAAKLGYTRQYVNRLKKRIWNMDSPR
ncbi:sigma-70 family RNA polymerase sigma factor [Enterocloster clostridioformis]|nr:sigma-70 family RNA polymerase sigma factor [Enterocloster clostridioformis]MDB2140453.1 sigma-70 family RNA polymerase sigma factor [Enterocloster clostridioformis]MDB2147428.1 sigma-70 family RNA polymerase sigma factor [Enterocloster clostridioformis]